MSVEPAGLKCGLEADLAPRIWLPLESVLCPGGVTQTLTNGGRQMSDVSQGPDWWIASDGKWYPPQPATPDISTFPAPPMAASKQQGFLVTIGDIGVTQDTVVTPNGNGPLAGSQWIVTDRTQVESVIPTWAIVMAIVFALACLLGLLFLLVKEQKRRGFVEVSVRAGDVVHMTQLPVRGVADVNRCRVLVNQAQSLAAQAR